MIELARRKAYTARTFGRPSANERANRPTRTWQHRAVGRGDSMERRISMKVGEREASGRSG